VRTEDLPLTARAGQGGRTVPASRSMNTDAGGPDRRSDMGDEHRPALLVLVVVRLAVGGS
jgi:hypothetical protein